MRIDVFRIKIFFYQKIISFGIIVTPEFVSFGGWTEWMTVRRTRF